MMWAFLGSLLVVCCLQTAAAQSASEQPLEQDFTSAPSAPYSKSQAPSAVSPSDLYFQYNLNFQSELVFVGNGGCSPSAVFDYLQIAPLTVPTVEEEHVAVRYYQAQPSAGTSAPLLNLMYFDLVSGNIITGMSNLNFSTQLSSYNYTVLSPTVTDLTSYKSAIGQLVTTAKGLADGGDNPCAPSDHRLDSGLQYLQSVQQNISHIKNVNDGLKPTEIQLPSGCIEEIDANYEGENVSGIFKTPDGTADDCCFSCKQNPQCNIFIYCPTVGGCTYGNNETFPFEACQLKHQSGNVKGLGVTPLAYSRGPPTPFASGRFA